MSRKLLARLRRAVPTPVSAHADVARIIAIRAVIGSSRLLF